MQTPTFNFDQVLPMLINLVIAVAVIATLFMLFSGGITWMLSGGKEEKIDDAKRKIRNAVIGLVIVLLSWTILGFVGEMFGVNLTYFNLSEL